MMFNLQTPITTKLLLLVFPLIWFEVTFGVRSDVIKVEEGSDVILPCSLSSTESIEFELFDWKKDGQKKVFVYDSGIHTNSGHTGQDEQFIGRVSHFEDELKSGNASIIIRNTKVADSGDYTCDFPYLQPRQIFHIKLVVGGVLKDRRAENIPGAATKPSVTSLDETKDSALLQCKVRGSSPKPKLHWQDSDGNILQAEEPKETERGGRYDVILQTTVTKTDNYRCVATQEEIKHQIYSETHVYIHEPDVIKVEEGSDVILPCSLSSKENIVFTLFDWKKDDQKEVFRYDSGIKTTSKQFRGRVSHFDDELKSGNASIIIRNTKVADSGNYTCNFTQLQQRQIFHIKLHVVAAAPKPYVKTLKQTKDWALLQCEVRGAFPKPKLHWEDRAGKILKAEEPQESERGGRYDIILQINVNKTNNYHCVATQEEIKHQIYAETHVFIPDTTADNNSGETTFLILFIVFLLLFLFSCCCWALQHPPSWLSALPCYSGLLSWLSALPCYSGSSSQPSEAIPKDSSHSGETVSFSPGK